MLNPAESGLRVPPTLNPAEGPAFRVPPSAKFPGDDGDVTTSTSVPVPAGSGFKHRHG